MKLELYFAPGACSFVPHVALEAIKAATKHDFEAKLVKLHKGEHKTAEYLALNPNGQVPVLVADGRPLNQIIAIIDFLDRNFPAAGLLPASAWARAGALSQLAWLNNTVHPTFTRVFRTEEFAEADGAKAEVKKMAQAKFRQHLERIQEWSAAARPYWQGERITAHDAYAFTLLRWGGIAGIDPTSLPGYLAYVEKAMAAAPMAAALERERVKLDTYKPA